MYNPVAYTYKANLYCPDCAHHELTGEWVWTSVEDALDIVADEMGVDRYDAPSYDSEDFPKACFTPDLELGDRCCDCGGYLRDGIPDGAAAVNVETASQWHGGQWSALCSLASTGEVQGYEHRGELLSEIDRILNDQYLWASGMGVADLEMLRYEIDQWPREAV